jgi:hypothetical protein
MAPIYIELTVSDEELSEQAQSSAPEDTDGSGDYQEYE